MKGLIMSGVVQCVGLLKTIKTIRGMNYFFKLIIVLRSREIKTLMIKVKILLTYIIIDLSFNIIIIILTNRINH